MTTKENVLPKFLNLEKLNATAPANTKTKPKSLRPMRSMVAVRSLKPKTGVASMNLKGEEMAMRD